MHRNQSRNNKRGKSRRLQQGAWTSKQLSCRASGRELPYQVAAVSTSSSGLIVSEPSVLTPTDTGGRYTILLPASIGLRINQLSQLYHQWKVNSLRVRYIPKSYQMGQTGPTAVGTGDLTAVFGFTRDPTVGILTQTEVVEAGGKIFNLSRPSSIVLNGSEWLYCQPNSGATLSDNRFISPCNFYCMLYPSNNAAAGLVYGAFEFDWDVSFRFPIDANEDAAFERPQPLFGSALISHLQTLDQNRLPQSSKIITDSKRFSDKNEQKSDNTSDLVVVPSMRGAVPSERSFKRLF